MRSKAKIIARAGQPLSSFYLDLALHTDKVQVNGRDARFETRDFQDVRITPVAPIAAGSTFEVVVDYSGAPGQISRGEVRPWFSSGQEWTVAGEPESAAWWFPSNDHPSDVALMDISIRVPAGLQAISIGRLESADSGSEEGFDTWRRKSRQPLAYLAFLTIGNYQLEQGMVDDRPYVYAVSMQLSPEDRKRVLAQLQRSGSVIRSLEQMFGPYPFTGDRWCGTRPSTAVRWFGDPNPPSVQRCVAAERRLCTRANRSRTGPHVVRRQRDCAGMERHLQQRGVRVVGPVGSY